ncbi:hypothetical protein SETIT_6G252200v2 [Setaria italica]|uniref:Uncharacterized protein n=1 Tax=Setaria italica TaxID=4555 RepID=A0A368RQM7_SETIT|nr:pentatricopeptide repeat-containing protein OTP51, chloroplastic-like [Setaria italica]RCV32354.1 hypothetical protein SETIT_6G252200v2 [Setaria italica]
MFASLRLPQSVCPPSHARFFRAPGHQAPRSGRPTAPIGHAPAAPRRFAVSRPRAASALEALVLESDDEDGDDADEEAEVEEVGTGLFQGEAWAAGGHERDAVRSPELQVFEIEELPEQWRRSRIAWLYKELPAFKHSTFTRILNAQRKWITQDDATGVVVHCLRIRNNDAAFRVPEADRAAAVRLGACRAHRQARNAELGSNGTGGWRRRRSRGARAG